MLVDMEREGIYIRHKDYLPMIEKKAEEDRIKTEKIFRDWAISVCPDAKYMNLGSVKQKQQLFFGPYTDVCIFLYS
jgi:hypothetical protein